MKSRFASLFCLMLALVAAAAARAGFSPANVQADARWVVYADLDSLRESALGRELISHLQDEQLLRTGGAVAVDFQKVLLTVGTVTAYGTNFSPDPRLIDGTLIAQGKPDLRKIVESLLLQATIASPREVTEVSDLPFPTYGLMGSSGKGAPREVQVYIAFPPEPVVIVTKSKLQLTRVREVLGGKAPTLANTADAPLAKLLRGSKDAFLFGASLVPEEKLFPRDDAPPARILQMTSAGSLAVGERGSDNFAHAELTASSPANAEKVRKILEGMTAMLSLSEANDKALADFLNATSVTKDGNVVTLDLAYPSARLVAMAKSLEAMQQIPAARPPGQKQAAPISSGKVVAQWSAAAGGPDSATRTIEGVELKNGSTVSLGRQPVPGRNVRFEQCEITPAGGGAPLVFRPEFMKSAGIRGSMIQFQFPGGEGVYNLKVSYVNDPDGKASYAVSVRDPGPPAPSAAPAAPLIPQPKTK